MFRHQGNIFRFLFQQSYISHHGNLRSAPLYRNKLNLKMLKYIKLMTINYNSMVLNIKIRNISRHNGQFFIVYIDNGFLI